MERLTCGASDCARRALAGGRADRNRQMVFQLLRKQFNTNRSSVRAYNDGSISGWDVAGPLRWQEAEYRSLLRRRVRRSQGRVPAWSTATHQPSGIIAPVGASMMSFGMTRLYTSVSIRLLPFGHPNVIGVPGTRPPSTRFFYNLRNRLDSNSHATHDRY